MATFSQAVSQPTRSDATIYAALFALLFTLLIPTIADATEIRLTTANDFLTHNSRPDDLYTFGLHVDFPVRSWDVTIGENAFTDREAGVRFDETELRASRTLPALRSWYPRITLGVVRVGHGLLGEGVQNGLHDILGDEELHLDYVGEGYHPILGASLERALPTWGPLTTGLRLELESAVGFKTEAAAMWLASLPLGRHFEVDTALGFRFTDSDRSELDRHLEEIAPAATVTLVFRERLDLTWTYNLLGTEQQHFQLGYRVSLGRGGQGTSAR